MGVKKVLGDQSKCFHSTQNNSYCKGGSKRGTFFFKFFHTQTNQILQTSREGEKSKQGSTKYEGALVNLTITLKTFQIVSGAQNGEPFFHTLSNQKKVGVPPKNWKGVNFERGLKKYRTTLGKLYISPRRVHHVKEGNFWGGRIFSTVTLPLFLAIFNKRGI